MTSAELTSITVDGDTVEQLQLDKTNTILVTTNLKTNTYGIPRVYYTGTTENNSDFYSECTNVVVSSNTDGYMTIQCETTPTTVATGLTLHIVPKGTPSSTNPGEMTGDPFCSDGTYEVNTNQCEAGEWKWGSLVIEVGDIAEPLPQNFAEIEYMQHMTPEICASANGSDTKQLIDKRDNKTYWVGKLPDGNCWMTQNLDLDLSTSKTFTPADTNISSNWTPSTSTTMTISGYNPDTGKSYDPGAQYYEGSGSEHYHVGNYYQWSAATAGYTGISQSSQSICPKGWTLPNQSQFQQLINSGLSRFNFMNAPYYLLRGGDLLDSSLRLAGSNGYYWSSTPDGPSMTHTLDFSPSRIDASYYLYRYYGLSVRCVAPSA